MLPDYNMKLFQYANSKNEIEWVVEFPDLKGCSAVASTPEQALEEAKIAKEIWLEAYYEDHAKYPEPSTVQIDYSGRLLLRMPKTLHKQLAEQAEEESVSMNTLCNTILAEGFVKKQRQFTLNFHQSMEETKRDRDTWSPLSEEKL